MKRFVIMLGFVVVGLVALPSCNALLHVTQVVGGDAHTCALRDDGTVACWGRNADGQLGDGTTVSSTTPVVVSGLTDAISIAAGANHTCAIRSDDTVTCWGRNSDRQLGNAYWGDSSSPIPVPVTDLTDVTSIAAGYAHTCATIGDGTVACWGAGGDGQLGLANYGIPSSPPGPVRRFIEPPWTPEILTGVSSITAGGYHTCARKADGHVVCWGRNDTGQVGNGTWDRWYTAVEVTGLTDATSIAAGFSHTCATRSDGTVACWGANGSGRLGNGSTSHSNTPVGVTGLTDATSIAAGTHTCATRSDGTVACVGANGYGQLGDGTNTGATTPVGVTGLADATALGASRYHTCAVRAVSTVVCWGRNTDGQLGNGTTTGASAPVGVQKVAGP